MTDPGLPSADVVVAAVLSCPYVAAMSGGLLGEVATYLPGRRVIGVRQHDDRLDVHVIGLFGPQVSAIAGQVRGALAALAPDVVIDVSVDDLADPGLLLPAGLPVPDPLPSGPTSPVTAPPTPPASSAGTKEGRRRAQS